jgi:hypothetical protein
MNGEIDKLFELIFNRGANQDAPESIEDDRYEVFEPEAGQDSGDDTESLSEMEGYRPSQG